MPMPVSATSNTALPSPSRTDQRTSMRPPRACNARALTAGWPAALSSSASAAGDLVARQSTACKGSWPTGGQQLGVGRTRSRSPRPALIQRSAAGRGCLRAAPASEGRPPGSACADVCWRISIRTPGGAPPRQRHAGQVSTKPASTVSGVRISCDTLATKSRRIAFIALALGDVLRQHQLLALAVGAHQHGQRACPLRPGELHRLIVEAPATPAGAPRKAGAIARRLVTFWRAVALGVRPKWSAARGIAPLDLLVGIKQHHAVGRGLDGLQELISRSLARPVACVRSRRRSARSTR